MLLRSSIYNSPLDIWAGLVGLSFLLSLHRESRGGPSSQACGGIMAELYTLRQGCKLIMFGV